MGVLSGVPKKCALELRMKCAAGDLVHSRGAHFFFCFVEEVECWWILGKYGEMWIEINLVWWVISFFYITVSLLITSIIGRSDSERGMGRGASRLSLAFMKPIKNESILRGNSVHSILL